MKEMNLPKKVELSELFPREGGQHHERFISTDAKLWVIHAAIDCGFRRMEATNFANPKRLPQFRDAHEVMRRIDPEARKNVELTAVTITDRGIKEAVKAKQDGYGPDRILNMISTSEAHNLRNAGLTHEEHWKRMGDWIKLTHENGMKFNGCVSTIWGCPIKGPMPINLGWEFAERFLEMGADDIEHADHDGQATPDSVYGYFSEVMERMPDPSQHVFHHHMTRGWGLADVLAAMQAGVVRIESSFGGTGGQPANFIDDCPVPGTGSYYYNDPTQTGLVVTEDLVVMLDEMGIEHGLDVDKVLNTGRVIERIMGQRLRSQSVTTGRIPKEPTGY
ncbi:MAG TPA: pyruvate carboxyltransferase [Dehalococcoidia bacterium]|nr:pyruvate carboxyltransferase [Dehalococcoidia bacterium]